MAFSLKRFFVDLGIGFVSSVLISAAMGVFSVETKTDLFRILSDGFFLPAAFCLITGGLKFTRNGGVMDGLGYSFKLAVSRIRRNFEQDKLSFEEYRQQRHEHESSAKEILLAGLILLALAVIMIFLYNHTL